MPHARKNNEGRAGGDADRPRRPGFKQAAPFRDEDDLAGPEHAAVLPAEMVVGRMARGWIGGAGGTGLAAAGRHGYSPGLRLGRVDKVAAVVGGRAHAGSIYE